MYIATQFSIFMVNKPGVLAQVLGEFAQSKINIIAMTMMDSVEHGVMRVVFAAPEKTKEVLSRLNMPYNETDVLCVDLDNRAGALAAVTEGEPFVREMQRRYRVLRDMACDRLSRCARVELVAPQGAFYAFPRIEGLGDSFAFCRQLLLEKLLPRLGQR